MDGWGINRWVERRVGEWMGGRIGGMNGWGMDEGRDGLVGY